MGYATVHRALKELVKLRLITIEHRKNKHGYQASNLYRINPFQTITTIVSENLKSSKMELPDYQSESLTDYHCDQSRLSERETPKEELPVELYKNKQKEIEMAKMNK